MYVRQGVKPEAIKVPQDIPTMKKNLFQWLSQVGEHMNNTDKKGVSHCWATTGLLGAWERDVQVPRAHRHACHYMHAHIHIHAHGHGHGPHHRSRRQARLRSYSQR